MKPGTILINAGRGAVINNSALSRHLKQGANLKVVLDVWEDEPNVNQELIEQVCIATPHIAGYSLDGKIRGTGMIYHAFCKHFHKKPTITTQSISPKPELTGLHFQHANNHQMVTARAIRSTYDIRRDDHNFRQAMKDGSDAKRKAAFDRLRKHYQERREFNTLTVTLTHCAPNVTTSLQALGFRVEQKG